MNLFCGRSGCTTPPCLNDTIFNISDFTVFQTALKSPAYLPVFRRFLELPVNEKQEGTQGAGPVLSPFLSFPCAKWARMRPQGGCFLHCALGPFCHLRTSVHAWAVPVSGVRGGDPVI
jgi:hypothetical protein